jgi:hypothetical protein
MAAKKFSLECSVACTLIYNIIYAFLVIQMTHVLSSYYNIVLAFSLGGRKIFQAQDFLLTSANKKVNFPCINITVTFYGERG